MGILSFPNDPTSLTDHFGALEDPRVERTKKHELLDIVVLTLCAIICGAEGWIAVEEWSKNRQGWLRKRIPLKNGIPSHDTIGRVFSALCPRQFQSCFVAWVESANFLSEGAVVAIDGKTMRRSHDRSTGKAALHMVSAWASQAGVALGHVATAEKSNEITAIPQLLDLLSLKGCIVTLDAMGCQRSITEKIVEQKADYVLALKGNQGTLATEVKEYFESIFEDENEASSLLHHKTVNGDHGRIETRCYWFSDDASWFEDKDRWVGLKSFIAVDSTRDINDKVSFERRYFISSLGKAQARKSFEAVREHWSVENNLHWTLDVSFREDECRIRKKNAAENAATLRKYALNLLKQEKTAKVGIKIKRFNAATSTQYLEKVLRI